MIKVVNNIKAYEHYDPDLDWICIDPVCITLTFSRERSNPGPTGPPMGW